MNTSRSALLLLAGVFAITSCEPQDSGDMTVVDESEFMQFVESEDGSARLEAAIVRYEDDQKRVVDLVGALHIGDREYYEELNVLFGTYDSLLYELVAPKDQLPDPEGKGAVSSVQRMMKDFLALEFQLDTIDYTQENFVHADLEPDRFFELMEERGESLFTLMLQLMLAEMKRAGDDPEEAQAQQMVMLLALFSRDRARALKMTLGKQFGDLERLAVGLEKGMKGEGSVLVVERNKAALEVMDRQLDKGDRRLGIFYGAAHLPDMERRLIKDHGFRRIGATWMTAWDIPVPKKKQPEEPQK